ncbi:MAG: EAL domain-containing protein [Polyangiaceae bacterium]|nr:EAL domain-containing protein [Polyangiaceae bacterium]
MSHSGGPLDLEAFRQQIALEVRAELRREWEQAHQQKRQALLSLTRSAQHLHTTDAFRRMTEVASKTLNVARVGIWFYDEARTGIRCEDLFDATHSTHASGAVVMRTDFPQYFSALEENRALVAHDARTDPTTRELADAYLDPLGITSMLDAPILIDGTVVGVVCNEHIGPQRNWGTEDISFAGSVADLVAFVIEQRDLRDTQIALRESEERYALAARGANDGLWDYNLRTGDVFYSSRFREMMGLSGENSESGTIDAWLARVHIDDRLRLERDLASVRSGESAQLMNEHRVMAADGTYLWVLARAASAAAGDGPPYRIAGSVSDITVRKAYEDQLLRDAFHDALTGLPNRALFLDRVGRVLERAKRHKDSHCAVLAVDADRFKVINESLGSHVGDRMLVALARVLSKQVGEGDTVARLGGDEFGILLEDVRSTADAIAAAERIFAALGEPLRESGHEVFAAVSIGIALASDHTDPEVLLRNADTAMYRAKSRGRDRYELFDAAMINASKQTLHLYTELRHAINRRQFILHYQPIVSLDTGTITGLEALVRWRHPQRGMVPPGEFISIAEETGLIHALGAFVLEEACAHAKWLESRFPSLRLDMSINLSPRQLARSELVGEVQRALHQTGLRGGALHLEITESTLMENIHSAKDRLRQLRGLGVGLLMDDFGTGYSSLSALHTFPIDTLKIDQSFVGRLEDEEKYAAAIVEAIVTVARRLGIRVIAEGIETARQLSAVREHGCHLAQGFFFSRPAPLDEVTALLERAPSW